MTSKELTPPQQILKLISTVVVEANTKQFVLKDIIARIKKITIWGAFTKEFLSGEGKIEDPINETRLCYYDLLCHSVDGPIIETLGGELKAETTLYEILYLIKKQEDGREGALLKKNGFTRAANIFFAKSQNGRLLTISVIWLNDSWHITAYSTEHPLSWPVGSRVFSRLPE